MGKAKNKKQRLGRSGTTFLVMTALLTLSAACEREPIPLQQPAPELSVEVESHHQAAAHYEGEALAYRSSGEHLACAESFAQSAKATTTDANMSARWYEAGRCAARAGDYRLSIFHLQAAASAGFHQLGALIGDPLFRPLYSGARWQLVVDLVAANDKTKPPAPKPLLHNEDEETSAPCALIEGLRERWTLQS